MAVTIQALRTFSAGNVVSRDPVIVVRVSVHPSAALGQAVERVAAALPELETGVFPAGADGAAFAHLVAAAAASIMRRLRHPGTAARHVSPIDAHTADIALSAYDARDGRWALQRAAAIVAGAEGAAAALRSRGRAGPFAALHPDDLYLIEEARTRGIGWRLHVGRDPLVTLGEGARSRVAGGHLYDGSSHIAVERCGQRWSCRLALREAGLPVPATVPVASAADAAQAARTLGFPVTVAAALRPRVAAACDLRSADEVVGAFERIGGRPALVEEQQRGVSHRVVVVDGKVQACIARSPPTVVGDGSSTVAALVDAENRRRSRTPGSVLGAIALDAELDRALAGQGLDRGAVPAAGRAVSLDTAARCHRGAGMRRVDAGMHPDTMRLAERAARVVGAAIVSVDLMTADVARSWREVGATILDVRTSPLLGRLDGGPGLASLAARHMIAAMFPGNAPARVPIFAVVGPEAAAAVAHMDALLADRGCVAAAATLEGVRTGGPLLVPENYRPGQALRLLVDDPAVEAAVIQVMPEALLAEGLGHGRVDMVIATGPIAEPRAAALLVDLAERAIVHHPDDGRTAELARRRGIVAARASGIAAATAMAAELSA